MLKKFLKYALSNVVGMLALSCYILVDTYFISVALGADGLTALNLAIPVYSFVHGLGLLLGVGGGTKYAVLLGEGKRESAQALFARMLRITACIAIALALLGALGSGMITRWMQADRQVFGMTKIYIQVILLFAPGFMLNDLLNCFVRNDGAPSLAMGAMLLSSFSNIILDYIFMFPLGMGMLGAVLATGLASLLGAALLMSHVIKKTTVLSVKAKPCKVLEALQTLPLGVSALVGEVSSGVVMIVFNSLIMGIAGNTGVAAYGVIANLSLVVLAVYSGLAQGAQPLISHAHGAGSSKNMKRVLRYEMIAAVLASAAVAGVMLLFARQIVQIFNHEQNQPLQQMAETGLKLYFSGALFAGCNIVLSAFFAAAVRKKPAQIISLLRGIVLILPMAFLMAAAFKMNGVWLSFPATEGIVAALAVMLNFRQKL